MKKLEWQTEKRKVSELVDHPKNPRILSKKSHDELIKSFEEFDYVELVAITKQNVIIAGHQRVSIMKELGWTEKEIEVRVPNRDLTEKEIKKYLLRSNKNVGDWNYEILANDFEIEELFGVGFTEEELTQNIVDPDDILEPDEIESEANLKIDEQKVNSKLGDVYQLDNHVLFCDDSSKVNFVHDSKDVVCFTDPPYELDAKKVAQILKKTGSDHFVMITSFKQAMETLQCDDFKFHFDFVINAKVPKSFMNRKQPYYTHQTGVYFSNNKETIFSNNYSKNRRSDDESPTGYWHTIIECPRNTREGHGHAKNIRGMCNVIAGFNFELIIDPFSGSGTSLLCADFFKKRFIGCELDPRFCDLTIKRYILNKTENKKDFIVLKNGKEIEYENYL